MFDLKKDLEKYQGVPPYASELYGVYQPLLGWRSKLTKAWVKQGGAIGIDPKARKILDEWITPGPRTFVNDFRAVSPLEPGSGRSPYTVLLVKDLGSELLYRLRDLVQAFVASRDGRLPNSSAEWLGVADINSFMPPDDNGLMRWVNDIHYERLTRSLTGEALQNAFMEVMQFESQIAAFWLFFAGGQQGRDPNLLQNLFFVKQATPLEDILRPQDPLALIDPTDDGGVLSPVGFVHLFRQYFFDLGSFLGEPVEHIWLAPGTTIELIEVTTRRTLVERSLEELFEQVTRSERQLSLTDELSEATKEQNQSSVRLGVTQANTVNAYVYQGSVSATFGVESTRSSAREASHKQVRQQSEKLATELKQGVKTVFKTVTETTDTRSRRYTVTNSSDELRNYELRRKMRRVGVQLQDIGSRLCWQVFVDNPGDQLGLAELVHLTDFGDLTNLKEPELLPAPQNLTHRVVLPLPFKPVLDYSDNRSQYEFQGPAPNGVLLGIIKGNEDDDDSQIVIEFRGFKIDPPQAGYQMTNDVRIVGVQGGKMALPREIIPNPAAGTFDLIMQRLNFGGENLINLDVEIVFAPTDLEKKRVDDLNKALQDRYDEEMRRALRKAYVENVRKRIKDASLIKSRPSWDLREEERTIVYRNLIRRLMLDVWNQPDTAQLRRVAHVRSEIVRSIFDVDAMLYFVAPEWWMPRRHSGQLGVKIDLDAPPDAPQITLDEADIVRWGGINAVRPDNYKITEDSAAAPVGSSLGWLLQLDGDNLRNAFLNAPWVKAVIPIRPGHEEAALNWLQAVEGVDGWDAAYLGTAPEDAEFQGQTIGEVLATIAGRLQAENQDIGNVLAADRVFENGFDPLDGGFDAGLPANEVYDQWISVVPTDQIVAVAYEPTTLFEP